MNPDMKSFEEFKEDLAITICGGVIIVYNNGEKICSFPILVAEFLVSIPPTGLYLDTIDGLTLLQGTKNQNYVSKNEIVKMIYDFQLVKYKLVIMEKSKNKITISGEVENYKYEKLPMAGW